MINTISQLSPLIVVLIAFCYRKVWDKGLRGIFYLYLIACLFEIVNEIIGGSAIVLHLWTPIEAGLLLYIYSQWSNFNYKAVFIVYFTVSAMIKVTGIESIQGMDTLSLLLVSMIFIFIPMYVFDQAKFYQRFFMLVMAIYYGGCLVFTISIDILENKILAWEVHSFFNIIAAIGSAAVYIIRNNEIVCGTRSAVSDSLSSIRKE